MTAATYYRTVRPLLLHHLAARPIMLVRFPAGLRQPPSHDRDVPPRTPAFVRRTRAQRRLRGPDHLTPVLDSVRTFAWMARQVPVELHPYNHRWRTPHAPTAALFDLDPGRGADVLACARVALVLRDVLAGLGLPAFVKTSGSKGIHVHVPVPRGTTYAQLAAFARPLATALERAYPALVTAHVPHVYRVGKVYIDWTANGPRRTLAGPYTWRWSSGRAQVAFPITWDELATAVRRSSPSMLHIDPSEAVGVLALRGDAWAAMLSGPPLPRLG